MKRAVIVLAAFAVLLVGFAPAAQASRVRCTIPGNYKVVCYNLTPYRVNVTLKLYTTNGLYVRYFSMPFTRKTVYSPAYINRITWRWRY